MMMKDFSCYLCALIVFASAATTHAKTSPAINKDIDQLTQTWLSTEQSTDKLISNWQLEQQLLSQRIAILKQQNKQLKQTISATNTDADELTVRRQDLLTQQGKIEQTLAEYKKVLPKFSHAMQTKAALAPPHLQQQLRDTLDKLSDAKPLSGQYQALADTLKLWHKNDKLLQVKQGMIELAQQPLMTEQLYLGNDQAWFVSADGSRAGVGFASAQGWLWQELDSSEHGAAIAQAIQDAKHLTPGRLIDLPTQVGGH